MANTQAMCTSFKQELLTGHHAFGTTVTRGSTAPDTFKAALYLTTATYNASTTAYSTTGEVSGTNYTAGGVTISSWVAPTSSGTTAYTTPSGSFQWTNVTLSTAFDAVLIYNASQGNRAVGVHTIGSQTITASNFTVTMPVNDASNALVRIA